MQPNPFEDGRYAYEYGEPYFQNPHPVDSKEHRRWSDGWLYEQENRSLENNMRVPLNAIQAVS